MWFLTKKQATALAAVAAREELLRELSDRVEYYTRHGGMYPVQTALGTCLKGSGSAAALKAAWDVNSSRLTTGPYRGHEAMVHADPAGREERLLREGMARALRGFWVEVKEG